MKKPFSLVLDGFDEADRIACRQPEELEAFLMFVEEDKRLEFLKLIQESYALRRYIVDTREWLYPTHHDEIEAMLNPPD